jgi:hypothetical protein
MLPHATLMMQIDKDIVLMAVQRSPRVFEKLLDVWRDDPEIVEIAVKRNTLIYPYVSDHLRNDPKIFNMLDHVSISNMDTTGLIPKNDRKSAIKAIMGDDFNYKSLSPRMMNDKHIVLLFVHLYPGRIGMIPRHFLKDIDVFLAYKRGPYSNISTFSQNIRSMWNAL